MSRIWPDADDPCLVLQRKQEQTCAGCQALTIQRYMGTTKYVCTKAVQKSALAVTEMIRCRLYRSQE